MKRALELELVEWKNRIERSPLIIRGARQVGKSFLIENFGQKYFLNTVVANFEEKPYLSTCFESLEIKDILTKLSRLLKQEIIPGKTLIFFDEIQNCIPALKALRYFKEKKPELHVIAAGSFLEFVLEEENEVSFPVGRVQFLNMRPMSFMEFLGATGEEGLCELISEVTLSQPLHEELHLRLLSFVRDFFCVGGMPKAIETFVNEKSYLVLQRVHASILDFYRLDLAKYGKKAQYKNLAYLFQRAPYLAGKHFKYKNIDPESPNPARDYKYALHKLNLARVIHLVNVTSANGLPLQSQIDMKKFKLFFLDIGLLQYALEVDPVRSAETPLIDIHRGVLAEQFVAQELLSYLDPYIDRHLFYWDRREKGGEAEVDFVMNLSGSILPIEVKAGAIGKLKSLRQFLDSQRSQIGVKISEDNLYFENQVLSVPFYLISQLPRLVQQNSAGGIYEYT